MLKRILTSSDFLKNVLTLLTGTALAQVLSLAIAPILTRLYSLEDFGFFALYAAILSGIAVLAGGRYELAIMLPKEENRASNLLLLAFLVCTAWLFVLLLGTSLLVIFFPTISKWYLLLPFLVFSLGLFQIANNWFNRVKNYKRIAKARVINSVVYALTAIPMAYIGFTHVGLLLAFALGTLVSAIYLAWPIFAMIKENFQRTTFREIFDLAKAYKQFPLANSLQALSDMLQVNAPSYLIPSFFGKAVLGAYAFAMRILQAPVSLLGAAIAQVFYQKASETVNNKGNLKRVVGQTIVKSALVALPIPIVLILFGPVLFSFVFGADWQLAGEYARILSVWVYFDFIRLSVSQLVIILNQQAKLLVFTVIGNVVLIAGLCLSAFEQIDVLKALGIISLTLSILLIVLIAWIYQLSVIYNRNIKAAQQP